jgi:hypothetical protein
MFFSFAVLAGRAGIFLVAMQIYENHRLPITSVILSYR